MKCIAIICKFTEVNYLNVANITNITRGKSSCIMKVSKFLSIIIAINSKFIAVTSK